MAVKELTHTLLTRHNHAVVGFLIGFFFAVLVYSTFSGQFAVRNPIVILQSSPAQDHPDNRNRTNQLEMSARDTVSSMQQRDQHETEETEKMEEELIRHQMDNAATKNARDNKLGEDSTGKADEPIVHGKPICDLSDPRFDICEMFGDARTLGGINTTVLYIPAAQQLKHTNNGDEWSIRDQSRKHLQWINYVSVKSLNESRSAPECTCRHYVPAVVFALNGLTSNPWHDFSDVLIPLFITTRTFEGEVQFLVTDNQPWFVDKYSLILKNLSRYDIIDFNQDNQVRCFPQVIVGLRSHRDLNIDPTRAPRNYTLFDFRMFVREIYSLPKFGVDIQALQTKKQPRLMLINRARTRKFLNFHEIMEAVEKAGFEVVPVEPQRDVKMEEFSNLVDSCDVLMGAHGAGLTNFFFLRTNALVLQVVPYGHMEYPAMVYFGVPARDMKLREVEYSISAEESSLYEKYGKDAPVISDPESIHKQGWQMGMRYYWTEQDIRLNVTRFAPSLLQAMHLLLLHT